MKKVQKVIVKEKVVIVEVKVQKLQEIKVEENLKEAHGGKKEIHK